MTFPLSVNTVNQSDGSQRGPQAIMKFGVNPTGVAAVAADVWDGAGDYGGFFAASNGVQTLQIVSTSAADAAAGTGAREVRVSGLGAEFQQQTELVTMNGTTVVPLVASWFRVSDMEVTDVGSGGANAGDITLDIVGGGLAGTIMAFMRTGFSKTLMALYSVPSLGANATQKDRELQIRGIYTAVADNVDYQVSLLTADNLAASDQAAFATQFIIQALGVATQSPPNVPTLVDFPAPIRVRERADIRMRFLASGNCELSAGFSVANKAF